MKLFFLLLLLSANSAFSGIGSVIKVVGTNNGYIQRGLEKIQISESLPLELNDSLSSVDSHVVIHLYPGTQLSLSKNSEIRLSQHVIEENKKLEKAFSVIDFLKGLIRVQVTRTSEEVIEQEIKAKDVAFAVRGTEFEVSYDDSDVDLDVMEGEVVVSSPYVHSFVPEVVKANEGFRFDRRKKAFARRKFSPKFRNHPGFLKRNEIRERWKIKKSRWQKKTNKNKSIKNKRKNKKRTRN